MVFPCDQFLSRSHPGDTQSHLMRTKETPITQEMLTLKSSVRNQGSSPKPPVFLTHESMVASESDRQVTLKWQI